MDFLYLLIACLFFSVQFLFQKNFQKNTRGDIAVSLWNQFAVYFFMTVYLAIKTRALSVNGTAMLYSILYSVSGLLCAIASLFAMRYGKVSAVSSFCLAGGMVLPFFYGIFFLDETVTAWKILGILVLCASLVPSLLEKDPSGKKRSASDLIKYTLLSLVVFFGNGFVSIFSKAHQVSPNAIDTDEFVLLNAVVCLAITGIGMLVMTAVKGFHGDKKPICTVFYELSDKPMIPKIFLLCIAMTACYAMCNGLGNIFSLRCAITMDSSIQFPLLSGIVIFLTAILGRICFREKIAKNNLISLALTVVGITLFIIPA